LPAVVMGMMMPLAVPWALENHAKKNPATTRISQRHQAPSEGMQADRAATELTLAAMALAMVLAIREPGMARLGLREPGMASAAEQAPAV
jgi:D-aminopeptidase